MTKQNKPTSKIIQIVGNGQEFMALCEDGSIWERAFWGEKYYWQCILEAGYDKPKENKEEELLNVIDETCEDMTIHLSNHIVDINKKVEGNVQEALEERVENLEEALKELIYETRTKSNANS